HSDWPGGSGNLRPSTVRRPFCRKADPMAHPDFGLSILNGVTFDADAFYKVTGVTSSDVPNGTVTVTFDPAGAIVPNGGFTTDPASDPTAPGVNYSRYTPGTSTNLKIFADLDFHATSNGLLYQYHIIGFADNALLLSWDQTNVSGATTYWYVLSLANSPL